MYLVVLETIMYGSVGAVLLPVQVGILLFIKDLSDALVIFIQAVFLFVRS